jgi:hypothetical protein
VVGLFADELGVEAEAPARGEALTADGQFGGVGDEVFFQAGTLMGPTDSLPVGVTAGCPGTAAGGPVHLF